jgi:CysZ protein
MEHFISGFIAFFRGMIFSLKHFRFWYLIPILFWLILSFTFYTKLNQLLMPYFLELIESFTRLDFSYQSELDSFDKSLKIGMSYGVLIVLKILIFYVINRYMKYIVLIVLSPLFAYLSERTEDIISGKKFPFKFIQFLKDIARGIGITIRNLFIETMLMAIGLVLSFLVPFLSPVIILVLFLVNCYFIGFNFFDYIVERKKMNLSTSLKYMRSNKFNLLGFGFAYNLVSFVPFLDWALAPISGAVGAVIADSELPEDLKSDSFQLNKL